MSDSSLEASNAHRGVVVMLLPIVAVVLVAFVVIGLAMPVLPLHVHRDLGLGTLAVGLVAGAQFAAAFLSRFWSGTYADSRGAKRTVVVGLLVASVAGLLYLLSLRFVDAPFISVAILMLGRGVLGGAESFIVTGALTWGLSRAGARHTGTVMAWVGTAMFVAFAAGAPAGSALYARHGFAAIALATTVIPLVTLLVVVPLRSAAPAARGPGSFASVVRAVWMPGMGLALGSLGFGAITTFIALLFAQRGWPSAWLAFTIFAGAFAVGRITLGHLPDRVGGAQVALVSVLVEVVGQAIIWRAPSAAVALVGAALTGFGYTLVFPAFGVEAVRRAPPESRGLATGAYSAFLDVALGLGNPVLGIVADRAGVESVFLVTAIVVLGATGVAAGLLRHAPP